MKCEKSSDINQNTKTMEHKESAKIRNLTLAGIMETGDGLDQLCDIKVAQIHLEAAKGFTRIPDDLQIRHGIVGNGWDIVGHPPEIFAVHHIGLAVSSMMEMQRHLAGLLGTDVLRHQVNVAHQAHGLTESIGIDILNQEGLGHAAGQQEIDLVGLVHVAHLNGLVADEFVLNLKTSADFL